MSCGIVFGLTHLHFPFRIFPKLLSNPQTMFARPMELGQNEALSHGKKLRHLQ